MTKSSDLHEAIRRLSLRRYRILEFLLIETYGVASNEYHVLCKLRSEERLTKDMFTYSNHLISIANRRINELLKYAIVYDPPRKTIKTKNDLKKKLFLTLLYAEVLINEDGYFDAIKEYKETFVELCRSNFFTLEKLYLFSEMSSKSWVKSSESLFFSKKNVRFVELFQHAQYTFILKELANYVKSSNNLDDITKKINIFIDPRHLKGMFLHGESLEIQYYVNYILYSYSIKSEEIRNAKKYLRRIEGIVNKEGILTYGDYGGIFLALGNFEYWDCNFNKAAYYFNRSLDIFFNNSINYYSAKLSLLKTFLMLRNLESFRDTYDYLSASINSLKIWQAKSLAHLFIVYKIILNKYSVGCHVITSTSLATTTDKNLIASYKIYEIICLLAMGTFEPIHYRRDALRKFSYKMTSSYRPRVSWFLALLKEMDKTGYSRVLDKGSVAGSKIAELLKEGKKAKGVHNHYEYVRLEEWFVEEWFMRPSKKHLPLDDTGNHAKSRSN